MLVMLAKMPTDADDARAMTLGRRPVDFSGEG